MAENDFNLLPLLDYINPDWDTGKTMPKWPARLSRNFGQILSESISRLRNCHENQLYRFLQQSHTGMDGKQQSEEPRGRFWLRRLLAMGGVVNRRNL